MIYILGAIVALIISWSVAGYFGSNVEQAKYSTLEKKKGYEIREYPAHIVAQTSVQGSYKDSLNQGFDILAAYIFGGNTKKENIAMTAPVVAKNEKTIGQSEKIAMTAPVIVQNEKAVSQSENIAMTAPVLATAVGDTQIISFGMPRSYTLENLPTPKDSRIKIVTVPAKKYAVMRFSWYSSDARIKQTQEKLLSALKADGIETQGSMAYAGYNAPWTPPWMTRNEVLIEVK